MGLEKGFTLIELMFVILIISILLLMAYPYYSSVLLKTHRSEAIATLEQDQIILEQCYAQNFSYKTACDLIPLFPHKSTQGFYTIILIKLETRAYTLSAKPIGNQTKDTACASMTVDQTHAKTAIDSQGNVQTVCWNP